MNVRPVPFLAVMAVLFAALIPARAALIAYEGFDYTSGTTIANQSGGIGWAAGWATSSGNVLGTNTAGSLAYADVNGNALLTSGGSLIVGDPSGTTPTTATPNRPLPNNLSGGSGTTAGLGGTRWMSFLYKRLNLTPNPFLRQANLGMFEGGGERVAIGGPNTSATVSNVLSAWGSGGAHSGSAPFQSPNHPINPGSTYFVLIKTVTDNSISADTAYVWFNWTNLNVEPDISTAAIVQNEINISSVNTLRFQAGNANASGNSALFQVDEVRVGTAFADVTPNGTNALPPTIVTQPASKTASIGDNVSFTVGASGGTPFSYQWYFNTNAPLPNQTNSTLTLSNVQTNDSGGYSVVVTNSYGSTTSLVATLTVLPPAPPTISVQPSNFVALLRDPATINVNASGYAPLRYQWFFNNSPLANQTNSSLNFPSTQLSDAGNYFVLITNTIGSITSSVATLTVINVGPPGLPAFPGADGGAQFVTGGRGGIVYRVTKLDRNINHSEPGTLRYGLNDANFPANTPRTIVFDVGGVFWLGLHGAEQPAYNNGWDGNSRYNLSRNTTIAGQTAPGPVIIMGGLTKVGGTNTVVRNVTFAPGYGMKTFHEPPNSPTPGDFPDSHVYDALDISGQHILIDHCTAIYATDETISCNEFANHLTVQYCNIAQGQNYPQADAENPGVFTGHALGSLLQAGSNAKISVINNFYAHLKGRLPRVGSEVGTGPHNDFRNNVFYNWYDTAGNGSSSQPSFNNFIHNFYLAGPGGDDVSGTSIVPKSGGVNIFNGQSASTTRAFVTGNLRDTNKDGDANDGTSADANYSNITALPSALDVNIGVTLTATAGFTNVFRHAGARWWARPYDFTLGNTNAITTNDIAAYVDQRLVKEAVTGTGKIVAWADDPFNSDPNEGVEWRSLLALRADAITGAAPFNRPLNWDSDGDGMPDAWEIEHGLNPNVANSNGDFDNDGYTDLEEYLNELAAWPAPGVIVFTGATNNRYASIFNWQVSGISLPISNLGTVTTSSKWQPSRYDTVIISNTTVIVDSVGQHAGTLRLRDNGTLNITGGWLKVSNTLEIATSGMAALNLSGGKLRAGTLSKGASGTFNFSGGKLSANLVTFDLLNQGGVIAPGESVGQMQVNGNLTLQSGSLEMELGSALPGQFDTIVVNGNLNLGGTLNITNLPGFGVGTYTLISYSGALSGALTLGAKPAGYDYALDTSTAGQVKLVVSTGSGDPNAPVFGSIQVVGSNVIISGVSPTRGSYVVLTSTNVALPLNLWSSILTNTFGLNGHFSITNSFNANSPQLFYRLLLP